MDNQFKMRHGSLFSGIGGFDLAAQWMGWENVFHCEWMPFPQKVLKHYWPNAISYEDITKTDFTIHHGNIDILTGGFPCQPYSLAGQRKGKEDKRHLWPEMLRAIREIQPRWIVGENVRGIISWSDGMVFEEVCADLENVGYEVMPFILPACGVNAPHRRDRVWFVANANGDGFHWRDGENDQHAGKGGQYALGNLEPSDGLWNASDTFDKRLQGCQDNRIIGSSRKEPYQQSSRFICTDWENFPTQSPVCGGNDGIPIQLDGITFSKWRNESIKGYGNAIVPQVVFEIFKTIELYEQRHLRPTSS